MSEVHTRFQLHAGLHYHGSTTDSPKKIVVLESLDGRPEPLNAGQGIEPLPSCSMSVIVTSTRTVISLTWLCAKVIR